MAKDDERPQFNPKHRIAGAIILVSLAVIFVPMLLDESTTPAENQTLTKIPERDAADTKVVVAPVAPPVAEPAKVAEAEAPKPVAEAPVVAKPEPVVPESKPAVTAAVEKKEPVAKAKPVSARPSDVSKGWVVQVGTFANADNAGRLREKLQGQGYTVNAESVTVQGNKAVRLRVGPYRDKTSASKVQAQLQKELSIQGVVLAYP
jgi:DedD protein